MRARLVALLVGGLLAGWAANKISYSVRQGGLAQVSDRWWRDFQQPLHVSTNSVDLIVTAVAIVAVVLIAVYQWAAPKATRPGEEHGSARWGTARDIAPFTGRAGHQLLFTRTERLSTDSFRTQRNTNALVVGSSGSGKTRYYVIPNIASWPGSMVITDPKGEERRLAAGGLARRGYQIRCLDLVDLGASWTFNPLAYLRTAEGRAEEDILTIAETIINNTSSTIAQGKDAFWDRAERALLSSLIAMCVFADQDRQATLIDVADLLGEMRPGDDDAEVQSVVDAMFLEVAAAIPEERARIGDENTVAHQFLDGREFATRTYNVYRQGAHDTRASVIISLGVRLSLLNATPVRRLLGSDQLRLDRIGFERTALFLVIPDTNTTWSFLTALFYAVFYEMTLSLADQEPTGRLPVPTHCFHDEFVNTGRIPAFETKIAVMRSRGLSASLIVQTWSHAKALYKDAWEGIAGNCDSLLFLGGAEQSTVDMLTKRLGKETILSRDDSQQLGPRGGGTRAYRHVGRELMTPDEISRMPGDQCLYFLRGVPPFRSRKLPAEPEGPVAALVAPLVAIGQGSLFEVPDDEGEPSEVVSTTVEVFDADGALVSSVTTHDADLVDAEDYVDEFAPVEQSELF